MGLQHVRPVPLHLPTPLLAVAVRTPTLFDARSRPLPETRRREWLLDIAFSKRETFAYACETYSRIIELAGSPAARRELLAEAEAGRCRWTNGSTPASISTSCARQ